MAKNIGISAGQIYECDRYKHGLDKIGNVWQFCYHKELFKDQTKTIYDSQTYKLVIKDKECLEPAKDKFKLKIEKILNVDVEKSYFLSKSGKRVQSHIIVVYCEVTLASESKNPNVRKLYETIEEDENTIEEDFFGDETSDDYFDFL